MIIQNTTGVNLTKQKGWKLFLNQRYDAGKVKCIIEYADYNGWNKYLKVTIGNKYQNTYTTKFINDDKIDFYLGELGFICTEISLEAKEELNIKLTLIKE